MEEEEWSCEERGHLYKRIEGKQSETCYYCNEHINEQDGEL